jgi:hypothetical protein
MSEESVKNPVPDNFVSKQKFKGVPETTGDGIIGSSSTNRKGGTKGGSIAENADAVIASNAADAVFAKEDASKAKKEQSRKSTVALYSEKNVVWPEVGEVKRGYNIVSESEASKWLTKKYIRAATPEEVAAEFGV